MFLLGVFTIYIFKVHCASYTKSLFGWRMKKKEMVEKWENKGD